MSYLEGHIKPPRQFLDVVMQSLLPQILPPGDVDTLLLLEPLGRLPSGGEPASDLKPGQLRRVRLIIRNSCVFLIPSALCSDHHLFTLLLKEGPSPSKSVKMTKHTPSDTGQQSLAALIGPTLTAPGEEVGHMPCRATGGCTREHR